MKYGESHAVLKPLEEVTLPDIRFAHQVLFTDNSSRPFTIEDIHERLRLSELPPTVPDDVRRQFEIARNLMLYSWFVYEFSVVAEHCAYGTLELALRTVLPHAKKTIRSRGFENVVPQTLGPLLREARDARLIVPDKLPAWDRVLQRVQWMKRTGMIDDDLMAQPDANAWFRNVVESIPHLRNGLAHGEPKLYFGASFDLLELCFDLINALFAEKPDPTQTV